MCRIAYATAAMAAERGMVRTQAHTIWPAMRGDPCTYGIGVP